METRHEQLSDVEVATQSSPSRLESTAPRLRGLPLELIDDHPFQPRREIDEATLESLVRSIRKIGLLQPITVQPNSGRYRLIAGRRRTKAFTRLRAESKTDAERNSYAVIPGIVVEGMTDAEIAAAALVENMERDDLTSLEAAAGLSRLRELNSSLKTAKDLASFTGLQEDRIQRLLTLCAAPAIIRDAVWPGQWVPARNPAAKTDAAGVAEPRMEQRRLELTPALAFTRFHNQLLDLPGGNAKEVADEKTRKGIARALNEGWTSRRVEQFIASELGAPKRKRAVPVRSEKPCLPAVPEVSPSPLQSEHVAAKLLEVALAPFRAFHGLALLMRLWLWVLHHVYQLASKGLESASGTKQADVKRSPPQLTSGAAHAGNDEREDQGGDNTGGTPKKAA